MPTMKKALFIGFDTEVRYMEYDKKEEYQTLRDAVDGYIEMVSLKGNNLVMWVNEEGKLEGQPYNEIATRIFSAKFGPVDYIMGNAVLTGSQKELERVIDWVDNNY